MAESSKEREQRERRETKELDAAIEAGSNDHDCVVCTDQKRHDKKHGK